MWKKTEKLHSDNTSTLTTPNLYHPEIDAFFRQHFIFHEHYAHTDQVNIFDNFGSRSVLYASDGLFKIYFRNNKKQSIFSGYLPRHAVLTSHFPKAQLSGSGELFIVTLDAYSAFLAEHPSLLSRALSLNGSFSLFNNTLRHDTTFESSKHRVHKFILYMAESFGTPSVDDPLKYTLAPPPSNADIASFFSIHPNNVSSFLKALEKEGYIVRNRQSLVIHNIQKLNTLVDNTL